VAQCPEIASFRWKRIFSPPQRGDYGETKKTRNDNVADNENLTHFIIKYDTVDVRPCLILSMQQMLLA
jgi:hypothetical protein